MEVVFVDTTLAGPPLGGSHIFLIDLCQELARRGWHVSVVTQPGPDRSLFNKVTDAGAELCDNLWRETHLPEERGQRLAEWVNSQAPDLYVISNSTAVGWLALPQLNPDIATITIAHNDNSAYYDPLSHYAPFVDIAVGVSSEVHRNLVSISRMPAERTREIAYGVTPISSDQMKARSGRPATESLKIGYVGRLIQGQKRILDLALLAAELKKRELRFELHVIGDGEDKSRLLKALQTDGTSDSVRLWGWQTSDQVKERLMELDVFLLMSEYEGLPVALLEAMAHGLAPVVTRIPSGNSQLVNDGENGHLVAVGDIGGFANVIGRLSSEPGLLRRVQSAAWQTSQDYTIGKMVDRYEQCFGDAGAKAYSKEYRVRAGGAYMPMPSSVSRYPFWLRKVKYRFRRSSKSVH